MKAFLGLLQLVAAAAIGQSLVSGPATAQSIEAVRAKPNAKSLAVGDLTLKRGLLSKPMNTKAEALVLLTQMRVASAALATLIQQTARISMRLRHKDRAVHTKSLAILLSVREEINAEIAKWEQKLSTAGDDAQLANLDLQNMLQKQQQTLQTISNVSKMIHDTAMAIIRKIG